MSKYIIDGFYSSCKSSGSGGITPPIPTNYFPLQTPNSLNKIDVETTDGNSINTKWDDFKHWDDEKYWFDVWYVE